MELVAELRMKRMSGLSSLCSNNIVFMHVTMRISYNNLKLYI